MTTFDSVEKAVDALYVAERDEADAKARVAAAKAYLFDYLEATESERETVRLPDRDITVSLTIVRPTSSWIDEVKLRSAIGGKAWAAVTRMRLDTDLLEARVADGTVQAAMVDKCTEHKVNTPYVKRTWKERGNGKTDDKQTGGSPRKVTRKKESKG